MPLIKSVALSKTHNFSDQETVRQEENESQSLF
jgi:hypothetical protein